jgi:hypothetical protein
MEHRALHGRDRQRRLLRRPLLGGQLPAHFFSVLSFVVELVQKVKGRLPSSVHRSQACSQATAHTVQAYVNFPLPRMTVSSTPSTQKPCGGEPHTECWPSSPRSFKGSTRIISTRHQCGTRACSHRSIALWPFAHRIHAHFYPQLWLLCQWGCISLRCFSA